MILAKVAVETANITGRFEFFARAIADLGLDREMERPTSDPANPDRAITMSDFSVLLLLSLLLLMLFLSFFVLLLCVGDEMMTESVASALGLLLIIDDVDWY